MSKRPPPISTYDDVSWDYVCNNRIMTFNWKEQVPDQYLIDAIIDDVHNFAPSKQRRTRYNIDVIANYANEDRKLAIYATTHAHKVIRPVTRYNPQVLAPWLLMFSIRHESNTDGRPDLKYENEAWLDIGIASQQVMLSTVSKGLAAGCCACIQDRETIKEITGNDPVLFIGIGYKNNAEKYYCPIKKSYELLPNEQSPKPNKNDYVTYL
tara:strand:- start:127 stop:756 length:630 start_codon:yes stop_codon:yes gene_type:complete